MEKFFRWFFRQLKTSEFPSKISWPLARHFEEIFMGLLAQHVKCIMFIMIDIFKIWWLHLDQRGVLRAQKIDLGARLITMSSQIVGKVSVGVRSSQCSTKVHSDLLSYFIHTTLNIIGSFDVKKTNTHQTFIEFIFFRINFSVYCTKKINPIMLSVVCLK